MIYLVHFENGKKKFTEEDFIAYVKTIFEENESDNETILSEPQTLVECKLYVDEYCDNFTLVKSPK